VRLRARFFISIFSVILVLGPASVFLGFFIIQRDIVARSQGEVIQNLNAFRLFYNNEIEQLGTMLRLMQSPSSLDAIVTTKTEGFALSRKLKETAATREIPVVLVTGLRQEMNIPYSFEPDKEWLPVRAILEKPVRPEALLAIVKEQID
jgi:CheY-like chemotaxis protein